MIESADHKYGLTIDRLRKLLRYDRCTGNFHWNSSGKLGGFIQQGKGTYRRIGVDGRYYLAHRLAWFYVKRVWPKNELDHMDGDGLNNSLSNLRECGRTGNNGNRVASKNSKSGAKGVHWNKVNRKWIAQMKNKKGNRYLGSYSILSDAITAYNASAVLYFGEFARASQ